MRRIRFWVVLIAAVMLVALAPLGPSTELRGATAAPFEAGGIQRQDPELPETPLPGDGDKEPEPEPEDEPPPAPPPAMKPPPTIPDSLRNKPAATLPGGAPMETLIVRPSNVLGRTPATPQKTEAAKAKRTPFGLHPVAIFAVLVVGHVFLVRAVTD